MTPISKKIRRSAKQARHQLDQVLLNLGHSSLQKMARSIQSPSSEDLIGRLGQSVLQRAGQIRAQLEQLENLTREPKKQIRKITRKPRQALKQAQAQAKAQGRLTQSKIKTVIIKNTSRAKSKVKAAVGSGRAKAKG